MDSVNAVKLYDGDGGNAQTEFILDFKSWPGAGG